MAPDEVRSALDQESILHTGGCTTRNLNARPLGLERLCDVRVHSNDEREGLERAPTLREHSGDLAGHIPDAVEGGVRDEGPGKGEELGEGQRMWGLLHVLLYEARELAGSD